MWRIKPTQRWFLVIKGNTVNNTCENGVGIKKKNLQKFTPQMFCGVLVTLVPFYSFFLVAALETNSL